MGWVWLAVIGGMALAALLALGVAGPLWRAVAAAAMLGAAGYAWQGRPTLSGNPVAARAQAVAADPGLPAFRAAMMPGEPGDAAVLAEADRLAEGGDARAAVRVILDAIAARPRDAALWTGLGSQLVAHDRTLSPPARFAFAQAFRLAPNSPAPPFFLGLAQVQAGELAAARPAWVQALALAPRDAPYRAAIIEQLQALDGFIAMEARR